MPASVLYTLYRPLCHAAPFRTFFLFGSRATYARSELPAAVDLRWRGDSGHGWKMALCARDVGILAGALLFSLVYARRFGLRRPSPLSFALYPVLAAPMALDGTVELLGGLESTWRRRLATGALFGLASAWLIAPRIDAARA